MRGLLAVALCCWACDKKEVTAAKPAVETTVPVAAGGKPWPTGSLVTEPIIQMFGVYALPGEKRKDVEVVANELRGTKYTYFTSLDSLDVEVREPGLKLGSPPIAEFPPPPADMLEAGDNGLTPELIDKVQKSPKVVMLGFTADKSNAARVHRDAIAFVAEIAEQTGGLIWDEDTRELFTREAWKRRETASVDDPKRLTEHFDVVSYPDGELLQLCTQGLSKFGLPDLVVEKVPRTADDRMGDLMNAVAITMATTPTLLREGVLSVDIARVLGSAAPGKPAVIDVHLVEAQRDEGDAPGALVEIAFPGPAAGLHERQLAVLDSIRVDEDNVEFEDHDDPATQAASAQARKELALLESHFRDGVPPLEMLMVKAPFAVGDGGTEWMWVEVTRWRGKTLTGILSNEPIYVRNVARGAQVDVELDSVFDYVHRHADGTIAGEVTKKVLKRRDKPF